MRALEGLFVSQTVVMEVNPEKFDNINHDGAKAFGDFLLSDAAQARRAAPRSATTAASSSSPRTACSTSISSAKQHFLSGVACAIGTTRLLRKGDLAAPLAAAADQLGRARRPGKEALGDRILLLVRFTCRFTCRFAHRSLPTALLHAVFARPLVRTRYVERRYSGNSTRHGQAAKRDRYRRVASSARSTMAPPSHEPSGIAR